MADKIPVIVDNRADNTVLKALQKLAPNLRGRRIAEIQIDKIGGIGKV